jgi:Fe-S-cluster containining protein
MEQDTRIRGPDRFAACAPPVGESALMKRNARAARQPVWYEDGLRFACTLCGRCCRDREVPSYVFLREDDIHRLAEHLQLPAEEFLACHAELHDDCAVLRNKPGACTFWEEGVGCTVYAARPLQCRTWPFWPYNLREENWSESAEFCPGCNRGKLHTRNEIEAACREMLGGCGEGSLWPGEIPLVD